MKLNERVESEFSHDRRRALLRRMLAGLRRKPASTRLLSFDDAREASRANSRRTYPGARAMEVDKIVVNMGRWSDFAPSSLLARPGVGESWKRVDRAFHRGEDLPPV